MAKQFDWSKRAAILGCSGAAGLIGLLLGMPMLLPLFQCLIDLDDEYDALVYVTIHYSHYAVAAYVLVCCAIGGFVGRLLIRPLQESG